MIDVGINRVQDPVTGKSRLVGDVDFEGKAVKEKKKGGWGGSIQMFLVSSVSVTQYLSMFMYRCETEGRLHNPCPWRCGAHDRGNAYEEHNKSS